MGDVSEEKPAGDGAYARPVASVDTLKALADPVRLAILTALMEGVKDPRDLPVMSVKELAAELGEPQTKLYRHVKQLEAAGLIRVASTRVVSGIVEQRYQACQTDLFFGREILRDPGQASEAAAMVAAAMNRYLDRFLARQASAGDVSADTGDLGLLATADVSPETARLIRGKLKEVADIIQQHRSGVPVPDGETTVTVEVLLGFFSPEQDGR